MGVGRVVGGLGAKVLGAVHKGQSAVTGTAAVVGDKAIGGGIWAVKKGLLKNVDKSFANGYTGYKANAALNIGATALGVGMIAGGYHLGAADVPGLKGIETRGAKVGTMSYGGAPTIMDADGVGTSTQAPTLGATGDLVFGLHNGRRG